jgi:hypothetical protein
MLEREVVTMFPQIPAKLPPVITKGHDMVEFIMSMDMAEHDPSGPVALAWRWALTGQGPTPITLMDWSNGPPSRQDIAWQVECPDEWHGQVPWDEVRAARSVLWWLTSGPGDEIPSDLLPIHPTTAAESGPGTATMTGVYPGQGRPPDQWARPRQNRHTR